MTDIENVEFIARVQNVSTKEVEKRAVRWAEVSTLSRSQILSNWRTALTYGFPLVGWDEPATKSKGVK